MVHLEDAEAALTAMMRSHWLPSLLTQALLTVLHLHVLALEGWSHAFRDASGVGKGRTNVTNVRHETEAIEREAIEQAFERQRDALDPLFLNVLLEMPVEDVATIGDVLPIHYQQ